MFNLIPKIMAKESLNSMDDLLLFELRDIYSAEEQILQALPKMAEAASEEKLKKIFQQHLNETQKQKMRLDKIAEIMETNLSGMECKAMQGLIAEGQEILQAQAEASIKDAALIAAAQRIEHYEISAYGTAVNYAERMAEDEVADLLSETLKEEKEADSKLNRIAIKSINKKAEAVH
jgi:ferritin-like metal-binding protein YciE